MQQANELSPNDGCILWSYVPLSAIIKTSNEFLMQSDTSYETGSALLKFTRCKKILFTAFFYAKAWRTFFGVAFTELASPHS